MMLKKKYYNLLNEIEFNKEYSSIDNNNEKYIFTGVNCFHKYYQYQDRTLIILYTVTRNNISVAQNLIIRLSELDLVMNHIVNKIEISFNKSIKSYK